MNENEHLDTLKDIRTLMERSSRFLSLSGLSGVVIGLCALAAAAASAWYVGRHHFEVTSYYLLAFKPNGDTNNDFLRFHAVLAVVLLAVSLATAFAFTRRKARRQGLKSWDGSARRMAANLFLPLVAGGVFILALLQRLEVGLIAPSMLLFYGLALVNAGKYTYPEIRVLGLFEIVLGLAAAFVPAWGLVCWAAGFGALHLVYGVMMYYKYER